MDCLGERCQQGPRERGLCPAGFLHNGQRLFHSCSCGLTPTHSFSECPLAGHPLWKSLHFSLWTSHSPCSGLTGRWNCYWEAEQVLSPPCPGLGGWSPGKESGGYGPQASWCPERTSQPLHLLKLSGFKRKKQNQATAAIICF